MSLVVENIAKQFGRTAALNGVSLSAPKGEFLALLGPSGSGKTTLLRVLAGLEQPDQGSVTFEGDDFLAIKPRERRVGMVFQHYALFRHMTVDKNIAYGLQAMRGQNRLPSREIKDRVHRLLGLVQLEGLEKRYPAQLSGGQMQRVALARALAIEPRMLLLDEPFGALDAKVRKDLRRQLRRIHEETGVTTVFVTHDQEEAVDLADRVAVLNGGRIEQIGTPRDLASAPASAFVFEFLGDANRLACRIDNGRALFDGFSAPIANAAGQAGEATAWFRPYETALAPENAEGLLVTVTAVLAKGAVLRAECRADDGRVFEIEYPRSGLPQCVALNSRARLTPQRVFVFG
ncbi:MAG TPA: sulfate ABC transporter ATP-binding protein [Caulobacteraceae bacterium]|jgi:sulfate transport system ATP-binding protein